jgi:hypothetical protein
MNKSNKQTEPLLLKFKSKELPDKLGRCRCSERLSFALMKNKPYFHQSLEEKQNKNKNHGNKDSGLRKYQPGKC